LFCFFLLHARRRFRALVDTQGWRRKARQHFRPHLAALEDDCDVELEAWADAQWGSLYRFLTREFVAWLDPGVTEGLWTDAVSTCALGAPLRQPPPLLHSRSVSALAPVAAPGAPPGAAAPPPEAHLLAQPLLAGPAEWHHEACEYDVRRVTVFVSWRAFCPRFADSALGQRRFPPAAAPALPAAPAPAAPAPAAPAPAPRPRSSRAPERCPYCAAPLTELVAKPHQTFTTRAFHTLVMQPVLDSLADARLEEPPLFGSLAERDPYGADSEPERLSVCASGHVLYVCEWRMVDGAARDAIAEAEEEEEGYGGRRRRVRCAYADSGGDDEEEEEEEEEDDDAFAFGGGWGGYRY
jgi:hypothetical protein